MTRQSDSISLNKASVGVRKGGFVGFITIGHYQLLVVTFCVNFGSLL
jgi:hypothetical protein